MAHFLWLAALAGAYLWPVHEVQGYSSDPAARMDQMLIDSEDLRHIDKDRLEICETGAATETKPAQIQLDITIASIASDTEEQPSTRVLKDSTKVDEILRGLAVDGQAKIIAQPRLITLSGRPGKIVTGGQVPYTIARPNGNEIGYKNLGVTADFAPVVQPNGRIRLDISVRNGESTLAAHALVDADHTLVVRGGKKARTDDNCELVVVVTPRLAPPSATHRVQACFEDRLVAAEDAFNRGAKIAGLSGTVYLFANESNQTIEARGTIEVEAYDVASATKRAAWTLDARSLEKLKRKDLVGVGYRLFLPWEGDARDVKLVVTYRPAKGNACQAEPARLSLRNGDSGIVQVGHQAPAQPRARRMTLTDVVELTKCGIAEDIIIRQMDASGSTFTLTVDDILFLNRQGVRDGVIRAMQMRR